MTIFLRLLRTTAQNIFRHGLTSFVALSVITLLSLFFNGILFANFFQQAAVSLVNERLDLAFNFTKPVDEFQVNSLTDELMETFPEIRAVNFISSEAAFTRFLQNFGESNRELARWLDANTDESPLPATLVISANAELHNQVIKFLANSRLSSALNLTESATGKLASVTSGKVITLDRTLSRISFIATLATGILVALIVVAVLRLTILSRGAEITIMRLVGATRQFIRLPFIFEGVFFAVVASTIGSLTFFAVLTNFNTAILVGGPYGNFGELVQLATQNYADQFALLFSWQILTAALIGIAASIIATRRYLRRELAIN